MFAVDGAARLGVRAGVRVGVRAGDGAGAAELLGDLGEFGTARFFPLAGVLTFSPVRFARMRAAKPVSIAAASVFSLSLNRS